VTRSVRRSDIDSYQNQPSRVKNLKQTEEKKHACIIFHGPLGLF
jgi:hypothetical protein